MSDDSGKPLGCISTEWTFWCGLCHKWDQIGTENTRARAIKQARRQGWRFTTDRGWVCRAHKAKP